MKWQASLASLVALSAALALNVGIGEQPAADSGKLPADASLTILPVLMAGQPSKDLADVVALMLEKEGLSNLKPTADEFRPPEGATLDEMATALAKHVQAKPPKTDYVLLAEFRGSPGRGVDEVRGVLVNKAGEIVWKDSQTPDDAEFKRINPRNPMGCCVLLKERVRPQFEPAAPIEDGKMARLWAEKSGTPTEAQRAAMAGRQEQLKARTADTRVLVYPVLIHPKAPATEGDAKQLAELAEEKLACKVEVAAAPLNIEIAPNSNEQRRLWDLARAFRAYVRENKPDADYTLCAEYTIRPDNQQVWTVHFVVCDRVGEWVIVDFQNNHHDDFNEIDPQNRADCAKLIARRLARYLK